MTGSVEEMREEKIWEVCVWNSIPASSPFPASSYSPASATMGIFEREDEFDMGEDSPSLPVDVRMLDEVEEKQESDSKDGGGGAGSGSFWATFGFSSDVSPPSPPFPLASLPLIDDRLLWTSC